MINPLTIAAGCMALLVVISRVSSTVTKLFYNVREARGDIVAVSDEVELLKTLLKMLSDDVSECPEDAWPPKMGKHLAEIVAGCSDVVEQIDVYLTDHMARRAGNSIKWTVSGKDDIERLRGRLEAHKMSLDLALSMVELCTVQAIKKGVKVVRMVTGTTLKHSEAIREGQEDMQRKIAQLVADAKEKEKDKKLEILIQGKHDLRAQLREDKLSLRNTLSQLGGLKQKSLYKQLPTKTPSLNSTAENAIV